MTLPQALLAFLIAVHAAGHACLALDPGRLPWVALLLAGATAVGLRAGEPSADLARSEVPSGAWGFYGSVLVAVFSLAAGGHPAAVAVALYLLVACQVVFHASPGLGRAHLPLLVNAQALVVLASMVGGPLAVSAVGGHAVLVVAWLAVDVRVRRRLPLRGAIGAAVPGALVVLGWLALGFTFVPPRPNQRLLEAAAPAIEQLDAGTVTGAWVKLLVAGGLGLVLILVARKLLRRDEEPAAAPELPVIKPRRSHARTARARLPVEPVDLSGARGRVVRAWLRLLRRAARRDGQLDRSKTPAEMAAGWPPPASDLAALFARARYSREPVTDVEARLAERVARTLLR